MYGGIVVLNEEGWTELMAFLKRCAKHGERIDKDFSEPEVILDRNLALDEKSLQVFFAMTVTAVQNNRKKKGQPHALSESVSSMYLKAKAENIPYEEFYTFIDQKLNLAYLKTRYHSESLSKLGVSDLRKLRKKSMTAVKRETKIVIGPKPPSSPPEENKSGQISPPKNKSTL